MKVRFIVNPAAGRFNRVEAVTCAVREVLSSAEGYFDIKVPTTTAGAQLFSRQARDLGFDAVFACGGDGTINEVATPLVGSATALGVVPMGSGNGFALSLSIPTDLREAVAAARTPGTTLIDAGEVCGRYFFSTAGLGFDAALSKRYNESHYIRRRRGLAPYGPLALAEFFHYTPEPVVIRINNESIRLTPFILTVANTERYGGGAVIAPGARPDDGLLDVAVATRVGLVGAAGIGLKLMTGRLGESGKVKYFRGQEIEVQRTRSTLVHADGEPFEWGGSILFRIRPASLRVVTG
ncbi:MAG: diacylglycerol/lipid kinase family protein [Thermodesulfobacteriota bacterium]